MRLAWKRGSEIGPGHAVLHDNLGATGWSLTKEQLDKLTGASQRPLPYPYELQRLPQFQRRLRHPT